MTVTSTKVGRANLEKGHDVKYVNKINKYKELSNCHKEGVTTVEGILLFVYIL